MTDFVKSLKERTFVSESQPGLCDILELYLPRRRPVASSLRTEGKIHSLPQPQVLDKDLIERVSQQEDFVATRMELLDEHALGEDLRGAAHVGDVEDLSVIRSATRKALSYHQRPPVFVPSFCSPNTKRRTVSTVNPTPHAAHSSPRPATCYLAGSSQSA